MKLTTLMRAGVSLPRIFAASLLLIIPTAAAASDGDFVAKFADAAGGCAKFLQIVDAQFAQARPFGTPLAQWTQADVEAFMAYGTNCIRQTNLDDLNYQQFLIQQYASRRAGLTKAIEDAKTTQLDEQQAASASSQQALTRDQAQQAAAALAARMRKFTTDHGGLTDEEALAQIDQLLAEEGPLGPGGNTVELWHAETDLLDLRQQLQAQQRNTPSAGSSEQCYSALKRAGYDYDWSTLPTLYVNVDTKTDMGQFLCLFLRQNALQSFQLVGPQEARANIGGVDLHFRLEKAIATDAFFADPSTSTPGSLWFAVVDVTAQGQNTELHNFNDSIYVTNLLIARFGAPIAE